LLYENHTRTLIFKPADEYSSGRTYYFTIVVRETNSDSVYYPYYCTIKMTGEIISPVVYIDYTNVNYTIQNITSRT